MCAGLAGCGGSADTDPRAPVPAAHVALSAADREAWAPGPARRAGVPVLLFRDMDASTFARQMALLAHAGYETITLEAFARFVVTTKPASPRGRCC